MKACLHLSFRLYVLEYQAMMNARVINLLSELQSVTIECDKPYLDGYGPDNLLKSDSRGNNICHQISLVIQYRCCLSIDTYISVVEVCCTVRCKILDTSICVVVGFTVERFIRPPITLTIRFPCSVRLHSIQINNTRGSFISTGFEVS